MNSPGPITNFPSPSLTTYTHSHQCFKADNLSPHLCSLPCVSLIIDKGLFFFFLRKPNHSVINHLKIDSVSVISFNVQTMVKFSTLYVYI